MPRGPRRQHGGPRQGQPGQNYTNRSDMQQGQRAQAVRTATGLPYGQAGQLQAAQQQVPLPGPPSAPPGASPGMMPGAAAAGPWNRPTERPGEPVTTGLTAGPGAGPEALQASMGGPDIGTQLRGLMLAFPESDQIRHLVTAYDARQQRMSGPDGSGTLKPGTSSGTVPPNFGSVVGDGTFNMTAPNSINPLHTTVPKGFKDTPARYEVDTEHKTFHFDTWEAAHAAVTQLQKEWLNKGKKGKEPEMISHLASNPSYGRALRDFGAGAIRPSSTA